MSRRLVRSVNKDKQSYKKRAEANNNMDVCSSSLQIK